MKKAPTARLPIIPLPRFNIVAQSTSVHTQVVPVFQNSKNKPYSVSGYDEILKKLEIEKVFDASYNSLTYVRFAGIEKAENVLFVGIGSKEAVTADRLRQCGGAAWRRLCDEKVSSVSVIAENFELKKAKQNLGVISFLEGLIFPAYRFHHYRTELRKKEETITPSIVNVIAQGSSKAGLAQSLDLVRETAVALNVCRDWSNEPSNIGYPEYFAHEARKLAHAYGLKFTVLGEAQARKEKMNLFLGVSQGSEREGQVVILEYVPKKKSKKTKTIALVGKGVTFDSGGISIKPSLHMEEMKHDMTGAATVVAATLLAARKNVSHRVVTIIGLTENMPSGNAMQPGNVVEARNGKTVEVINTDAEGRLVLADLLDYIQDKVKPDVILDAATLTGAVSVALGKIYCGILGNNRKALTQVKQAAKDVDEKVWELPLDDMYFEELKCEHADFRNTANSRLAGTIQGAIFLKQFIKNDTPWVHFDIAGTAWDIYGVNYYPKRDASGAHVRTITKFIENFS